MIEVVGAKKIAVGNLANESETVQITVPNGIRLEDFRGLLIAVEHCYDGGPVNAEQVSEASGTPIALVRKVMATEEFQLAAEKRGTPLVAKPGLSEQQLLAIPILLDFSTPTLAARLRRAGISMKEYSKWKRNPTFRLELNRLGGNILKDAEDDIVTSVAASAVNGDLRAAELALEMTGTYNRRDNTQHDMRAFANQVLEILYSEINDSEQLTRIAARIALAQGAPRPETLLPTHAPALKEITNG